MSHPANRTILLIDDSEEHQILIEKLYTDAGYKLFKALNGQDGLNLLSEIARDNQIPAFILLDLAMPVMDGYDFRKAQLADSRWANIPVVILTSDGQIEKKTMQMGAAGYIKKPVSVERLLEEAARFCH